MKKLFAVLIFTISLVYAQDDWSSSRQLSRDGTYPTLNFGVPAITVDSNGVIHAFWIQMLEVDGSWTNGFYDQIEYRRSSDGGKTWTTTENLTTEYTTERIYYMKAACDSDNNVHIVYLRGSEVLKVMHKIYDGESWSEPYEIYPYSTKTVLLKFDGIDRLFCTWYLGSASYYSYCYLNADIPEWSEAKCVHVESNSRIDNFCLNSSGDVQAIGTYGDMFSYRPYYHLFDKESDQWIIHKEISNYEEKTLGTAIALSSKDSLYANVAVGQSLDNNKDNYLTRYLDDPEWTKPYTYGENNNWDREMYIDQNDYLHLFELHFYEGDVGGPIGLTHSIGKNRIWETVIIDSSTTNGYSEPNIAFDKVNNKFYLLYMRGDTVNHISRIFFRSKQNTTGIEDSDEVIVKSHDLYQNYPNPFNSSTNISYSISQPALVKLSVYNIKGEFVKDLINQRQNKGQHSVVFKTENLNSGIYYYRLTVDGVYQETRKMLYLK
jgi:hypothetical protein